MKRKRNLVAHGTKLNTWKCITFNSSRRIALIFKIYIFTNLPSETWTKFQRTCSILHHLYSKQKNNIHFDSVPEETQWSTALNNTENIFLYDFQNVKQNSSFEMYNSRTCTAFTSYIFVGRYWVLTLQIPLLLQLLHIYKPHYEQAMPLLLSNWSDLAAYDV